MDQLGGSNRNAEPPSAEAGREPTERLGTGIYEDTVGKPQAHPESSTSVVARRGDSFAGGLSALVGDSSTRASEAAEVRARADQVAAGASSLDSSLQLDDIWRRDLDDVDLSQYCQTHSTTVSFPEKLMLLLIHIERIFAKSGRSDKHAPIAWALEGRAFVISDREELVSTWLPRFFRHGKFQSFTRKLYRWGFRQVNLPRELSRETDRELVFASPHFQRDQRNLMTFMKSVTAEGIRRRQRQQQRVPTAQDTTVNDVASGVALSFSVAPRRSAALGLNPAGMMLPQISPPGFLPMDQQAFLLSQQVGFLASLRSQALLNQQQAFSPGRGMMPLDPQTQQKLLLSLMLSNPQGQDPVAHALAPFSQHQAIVHPVAASVPFSQHPSATRAVSSATPQPEAPRQAAPDPATLERLRMATELLLRHGIPPPRPQEPPDGDQQERQS